jgi:hypothetical protein
MVMSSKIILDQKGFTIHAELEQGCVFLHCDVHDMNISNLKSLKEAFYETLSVFYKEGKSMIFSLTKNERFIKFLGYEYKVLGVVDKDSEEYKVVSWELK